MCFSTTHLIGVRLCRYLMLRPFLVLLFTLIILMTIYDFFNNSVSTITIKAAYNFCIIQPFHPNIVQQ